MRENKITWPETFVRWANKPHLKKHANFLWVTVTPLPPKSVASGVYTAFPQITQKILVTDTCHWQEPVTVILGFLKIFTLWDAIKHFRTIIFFSKSNILIIWNLGTFNAHHFLMREQFMCADCYTGRLTFSNIILHKNNIRKGECVPEV